MSTPERERGAEKDAGATSPRCICMRPGSSIQCVACYPDFGRRYNDARTAEREDH